VNDIQHIQLFELVDNVRQWNPERDAPKDIIEYIDISAIDRNSKKIPAITKIIGSEAPSRARQLVKTEDILVSTVRPNLNAVAQVTEEFNGATASTGYCVLRPKNDLLDSRYLFHWVRTPVFVDNMMLLATGASYPAVSDRIVKESRIPLPPLAEQQRIAAILDQADALRTKRRAALAKLDTLLQATFLDMFGDPVTNPMGWGLKNLGDVLKLITYGLTVRPKYYDEGIPLISAREIRYGFIDFASAPRISFDDYQNLSDKGKPVQGDILFSKTGTIGYCAEVKTNQTFAITQNAARMTFDQEILVNPFTLAYLRSYYFQDIAIRNAKGNAVKDLQLGVMERFPIYVPPLDLQNRFANIVTKIVSMKQIHISAFTYLNNLFHALQQRAFQGEL